MIQLKRFQYLISSGAFLSVLALAGYFKVSYLVGSKNAFLSGTEIVSPLAGWFGGLWCVGGLFLGRYLLSGLSIMAFLLRRLPGLCGALCWGTTNRIVRVGIPVGCMILFHLHPIGRMVSPYTWYWFIPIIVYGIRSTSVFGLSLANTFVSHAVGSVVWLYTMPMAAEYWWFLIPVVAVERCVIASCMAGLVKISAFIQLKLRMNRTLRYSGHRIRSTHTI
ncbi:hypothetical protein JW872_02000 [Candidatus Babeliales bacterium]|nr:hypothetical protein [Candidatus Babeliales bacterium]